MPSLKQIRYFLAVADQGGFTQAAAALFVAQPALSRLVAQLEEQMADLQANLDEVKLHEKQARALLAKARKVPAAATSSRPADPVAG